MGAKRMSCLPRALMFCVLSSCTRILGETASLLKNRIQEEHCDEELEANGSGPIERGKWTSPAGGAAPTVDSGQQQEEGDATGARPRRKGRSAMVGCNRHTPHATIDRTRDRWSMLGPVSPAPASS